ncbi:MAG: phosphate acyltransferase PlsX [Chloroflexota bacterium]
MTRAQRQSRYRIAVDAMGGDHAPEEIVRGAVEAAARGGIEVLLVGELEAIKEMLPSPAPTTLQVIPSQGVITEAEHPLEAFRQKPRASIAVAAGLVKEGKAHAFVTMGSTGAAMAAGVVALGNLEGIDRPALGGPFLGLAPKTTLLDLGTSIDCRPSQLLNYGVLGSVFAKVFLGIENPSVALLSVGAEEGKGNRQVREAYRLFSQSGLNFVGNVEGMDIPLGKVDVVVCDGFVGNVLMKFAEGLGMAVVEYIKARVPRGAEEMAGEMMRELANLTNFVEHMGGGPLLGLNGVAIVGHGRSKASSVTAAIDMACTALERGLVEMMSQELTLVRRKVESAGRPGEID